MNKVDGVPVGGHPLVAKLGAWGPIAKSTSTISCSSGSDLLVILVALTESHLRLCCAKGLDA